MTQEIPPAVLTMGPQCGTGSLATLNSCPVVRILIPAAKAVAPRQYAVASVQRPASTVPVRADTNPGQT